MEVTKKTHREEITRLFKAFYNIPAELHITLENVKVEAEGQNYFKQTGSAATIDDEITREPIIQTVLEVFEGEILG